MHSSDVRASFEDGHGAAGGKLIGKRNNRIRINAERRGWVRRRQGSTRILSRYPAG